MHSLINKLDKFSFQDFKVLQQYIIFNFVLYTVINTNLKLIFFKYITDIFIQLQISLYNPKNMLKLNPEIKDITK